MQRSPLDTYGLRANTSNNKVIAKTFTLSVIFALPCAKNIRNALVSFHCVISWIRIKKNKLIRYDISVSFESNNGEKITFVPLAFFLKSYHNHVPIASYCIYFPFINTNVDLLISIVIDNKDILIIVSGIILYQS